MVFLACVRMALFLALSLSPRKGEGKGTRGLTSPLSSEERGVEVAV